MMGITLKVDSARAYGQVCYELNAFETRKYFFGGSHHVLLYNPIQIIACDAGPTLTQHWVNVSCLLHGYYVCRVPEGVVL